MMMNHARHVRVKHNRDLRIKQMDAPKSQLKDARNRK
jgi:hypothetical protein